MLPAANNGAGMNIGFPDVCLTPVGPVIVPIPYPNFALNAMAVAFSVRVRVTMMNALNLGTIIPMTMGDEPGVAHWTVKGPGFYVMGNPKVNIEGLPGINLTCPTTGNNTNNAVGAVLVPSAVNVFYTYKGSDGGAIAGDPWSRAVGAEELAELASATASSGAPSPVEGHVDERGLGCVRIRVFSADVPSRMYGLIRDLEAAGMTALTIDLRGCPGGELTAALELAGDFVDPGTPLATLTDADGDATVFRGGSRSPHRFPLTLRVDRGTASAAEVFASALEAAGRATIHGGPTFGKLAGQVLVTDPERGSLLVTAAILAPP